jgi:adenylate cyclase
VSGSLSDLQTAGATHLEIERKFLLNRLPKIPADSETWRIEQGYLDSAPPAPDQAAASLATGRLRRTIKPNGSIACTHTIKRGVGLVRSEIERVIPLEVFEQHWPRTVGRRLTKTRHRVRENALTWEIDAFEDINLILAEVELPTASSPATPPSWLKPHIIEEVTEDPSYTNAAIAARIALNVR